MKFASSSISSGGSDSGYSPGIPYRTNVRLVVGSGELLKLSHPRAYATVVHFFSQVQESANFWLRSSSRRWPRTAAAGVTSAAVGRVCSPTSGIVVSASSSGTHGV